MQTAEQPASRTATITAVGEVMGRLTELVEVKPLLNEAVSTFVDRFGATLARIWLCEPDGVTLSLNASAGLSERTTDSTRYQFGLDHPSYKTARVGREKRSVIVNTPFSPGDPDAEWAESHDIQAFVGFPLLRGEQLLGVVSLFFPFRLEESYAASLGILARYLSSAVVRTTAIERERKHAEQMALLNTVGATLNSEERLEPLLQMVVDTAARLTAAETCLLLKSDSEAGKKGFRFAASAGTDGYELPKHLVTEAHGLLAPMLRDAQPVHVGSVEQDERYEHRHPAGIPLTSLLGVPLQSSSGGIEGCLMVGHSKPNMFGEDAHSLVTALATHASVAIEKARILQEERDVSRRLRTVSEFGQTVGSILDRDKLLKTVYDFVSRTVSVDSFVFTLWDEQSQQMQALMRTENGVDFGPGISRLGNGHISQAIRTKQPHYVRHVDAESSELKQSATWFGEPTTFTQAQLALPMCVRDKLVGALSVQSFQPYAYTDADVEMLWAIANQTGTVIENIRLYEELEESNRTLSSAFQNLQEVDRMKDEFLSVASHELRTPLTLIKGQVQLVERSLAQWPGTERSLGHVRLILRSVDRMTRLISSLLEVSRLQSGQMKLDSQPVDLVEVCSSVVEMFRATGSSTAVEFELPDDLMMVMGDRDRIEQVFLNLLSNAVNYSPPGGRVHVRMQRAGSCARVSVSDEGVGIPAEELPKVFERFYQSNRSGASRPSGGLGLGLYITRGLIEAHGGMIVAESKLGQGSTFTFELPILEEPLLV